MSSCSWTSGDFEISTDPGRIDLAVVHAFLTNSYSARGVPEEIVRKSIHHSICFGVYKKESGKNQTDKNLVDKNEAQVGFARIITDRTTFSYLADVFILEAYRGHGLAKWMMECILRHPDLQGLRRWALVTADAHGLYEQFGFTRIKRPERWMEKHDPDVYGRSQQEFAG